MFWNYFNSGLKSAYDVGDLKMPEMGGKKIRKKDPLKRE